MRIVEPTRLIPAELRARYLRAGWWTDDTLADLIAAGLRSAPTSTVRVWSATRPFTGTYDDLRDIAARLCGGLAARGIGPGDHVVFHLPNWIEAVVCFAALPAAGAVLVPVPSYAGSREVEQIVRRSGARMLITSGAEADRCAEIVGAARAGSPELEHVILVGGRSQAGTTPFDALVAGFSAEPVPVDPDAVALVAFTSGTGSVPKGVVHTHRSLSAEVRLHLPVLVPAGARPQLTGSPIAHAAGMVLGLLLPIHRGEAINLIDVWSPEAVFEAMDAGDLAAGSGAVYFLSSLLDSPHLTPERLARMETAVLGASAVPTPFARRARAQGVEVVRSYGLTEQPTVTGASVTDPGRKRESTDGRALTGVELRLLGPDGAEVACGEPGDLWTRGPDLMAGYTDDDANTTMLDGAGWLRTGDVAVLDQEGWLTITGRTRDVIIRHGLNIHPAEIEDLLLGIPAVAESAVVGRPHDRTGERACAVLRLHPGAQAPTLDDIRRHLQDVGLARPKWPEEIHIVAEFPRTASGKVRKFVLREYLIGDHASHVEEER